MALYRVACRRLQRPWQPVLSSSFSSPRPQFHASMPSLGWLSPLATKMGLSSQRPRSTPRAFPVTGFDVIGQDQLVEEEAMPEYRADHFYPVRLGEVFKDRFQTVAKLGYGSSSTIWLARDLQHHRYVALKIYIHNSVQHRELPFYQHLEKVLPTRHPGAKNVRKLLDSFEIAGPYGKHVALALQVSQMSIRDMDAVFMKGRGFDEGFVKGAVKELLEALDFLHTEVQSVHTDVHPGNLLLGTYDDSMFQKLEDNEFASPVPRKQCDGRTIYLSRLMKPKAGPLLLSDFGEARLGPGPHAGDIMPIMYRAPETLLRIQWSYPVDIWSVGLTAWDLLQGRTLFSARKEDGSFSDGVHFAELIAALGPPPPGLLDRHRSRALEYWDEQVLNTPDGPSNHSTCSGNWSEFVPIPREKTLAAAETKLEDNTKFLRFMRRALTWDPAARPTAKELLQDPWLNN
ncbi:protein kinase [Emericellopsis atlantica]|uniref:non-specific serine/threonine protein kinase n=1 Tax=Emericellopsis atlantica TaxID=2614577 RepID=A0A9P8CMY7_9HYPO|nr:protein kinase [Emericellopsis atlantica]KAG9252510.1 protein kinase [Emericellopsis atlantica]